jgi:multisubunit Na+/H+ antiporter MnhE subunit
MNLAPTVMRYRTSLQSESSRHLFTTMLSLMPGTQSIAADGPDLFVHVLVRNDRAVETALLALEGHVAAAFTEVH